jgi:hypothetical protein
MSQFYIASLKHTHKGHEHVTWWGRMECGYTPVLGEFAGRYVFGYAVDLNDGLDCIAVPVDAVRLLQSPEPYYRPGGRFYDQRGPVIENSREKWLALIAASLQPGRRYRPKPEPFRGKRRAIFVAGDAA